MTQSFCIANWKMHKTRVQAEEFVRAFRQQGEVPTDCMIGITAPYTLLPGLSPLLAGTAIRLGAQNMFYEEEGAFTGEISPLHLTDAGCTMVLIGHSERRHLFGETNDVVNKKIHAAFAHNLMPIYCVGETAHERDAGQAQEVVRTQVEEGLRGISDTQRCAMIIAYEPIWAIGTGRNATPEQAQEMHAMIRIMLPRTSLLYGGSVKPENAAALLSQPDINGFLVGGASLDPQAFFTICTTRS